MMIKEAYMRNGKGFTLLELLIVVAIIGILAVIAIPGYIGYQRRAVRSEAFANLEALRLLQEQFFAENNDYTVTLGNCAADQPGNVLIIQTGGGVPAEAIPNFRPGAGGSFSYCIVQNQDVNGGAQDPCFRAEAYGNTGTRVQGEIIRIDCNNDMRAQ
jgi:prepilin-type N-terminal cleavage/methylation domain-containing protein